MKERLKKLRKALDLTQQEFADRIGISRGNIATYETRDGSPGNSVIHLICREFNVSEEWLRTGKGDMFQKISADDELSQVFASITSSNDELIKRIIRAYWRMDDKEKATVKKLIESFLTDESSALSVSQKTPTEMTDEEMHAELDRHIKIEKEAAENASASSASASAAV